MWLLALYCCIVVAYSLLASSYESISTGRNVFQRRTESSTLMRSGPLSPIENDGFSLSHKRSLFTRFLDKFKKKKEPGTLILVRHGDSVVKDALTFTGWIDADLSESGRREVEHAARLLLANGYSIDTVYTSRLKRAIRSAWFMLREIDQIYRPVYTSWRLNERMYGSLEGLSKPDMAVELGEDVVQQWRTGLYARPPPMSPNHVNWHKGEAKYADLDPAEIPVTESLQDTMERTLPIWESRIVKDLQDGQNVLIVAHGNSLRGIVKHIDRLSAAEIQTVVIPNAIPLVYKFERQGEKLVPVRQESAVEPLNGVFLEKKNLLRAALERESALAERVPGYEKALKAMDSERASYLSDGSYLEVFDLGVREREKAKVMSPILRGLDKLEKERKLLATPISESGGEGRERERERESLVLKQGVMIPPSSDSLSERVPARPTIDGPVIVLVRHGKTENNKLGLFTGWEDAGLSPEGRLEASAAGKLLKAHGIKFDLVYTSWLSRAIETAWLILDELDSLWLPIIKSWRLNERMYGALTSLSKQMIKQRYGERQFKAWRRGYAVRPPPTNSFSPVYPGNEERYVKYVTDVRYSFKESVIRSLAFGKPQLAKKFPKTESLKDCMDRTIPYYKNVILPSSHEQGKNVLITTHENAIRGILVELCEIPPERIAEVEIPTGLPLVYNVEKKCVQLLEDGTGIDPVERYDFGTAPELLFAPCDIKPTDENDPLESVSDRCFIGSDGRTYSYDPIIRFPEVRSSRNTSANSSENSVEVK